MERGGGGRTCDALRRTAAGTREAEARCRRIIGYRHLAQLAVTIDPDLALSTTPTQAATLAAA